MLVACAMRLPRLQAYAFTFLACDVLRLAFQMFNAEKTACVRTLALYTIDGALIMLPVIVLAWALRLPTLPVVSFSLGATYVALYEVAKGRFPGVEGVYVAALFVLHLYLTIAPCTSRAWRQNAYVESIALVGLSATGIAGAIIAITLPGWKFVQASNTITFALTCAFCFLFRESNR